MGKYKDTLRTEKKEFRVTEEESAQIAKQAKALGMSESAFIRFAVNAVIDKKYIPPHLFEQVLHRVCISDSVKRDKALFRIGRSWRVPKENLEEYIVCKCKNTGE